MVTLAARECLNALVMALWGYREEQTRVTVESGGSLPDCSTLVGIDVIVVNVEAWELSTRPNSLPSKMGPASIGCLNSPHGRLRKGVDRLQPGDQFVAAPVVRGVRQLYRGLDAQANHVGGLGAMVS